MRSPLQPRKTGKKKVSKLKNNDYGTQFVFVNFLFFDW